MSRLGVGCGIGMVSHVPYWQNVVGCGTGVDRITRTAAPSGWDAGGSTTRKLTGAGSVSFSTAEADKSKFVGLSRTDPDSGFASIEFAMLLGVGTITLYESGGFIGGVGAYVAGDTLSIAVSALGVVTYHRNGGAALYTSAVAAVGSLLLDTCFLDTGGTITAVAWT